MRLSTLAIVVVVCTATVALPSHSKLCRYWCKAEGHHDEHAYYCCPSGKSETWLPESMWPLMASPIFWIGMIGTTISAHAHSKHHHWSKPAHIPKKYCPPVRSACPRISHEWYDPPTWCDEDEDCRKWEKCCYDICLEHKTCKPAE